MNGPGHMALGAASGAVAAGATMLFAAPAVVAVLGLYPTGSPIPVTSTTSVAWLTGAGAVVGTLMALWPDIDTRGTLTRMLGVFGAALSKFVRSVSYITHGRKHRGLTHEPMFVLLSSLPWFAVHPVLMPAALAGGMSHIIADPISSAINRRKRTYR